MQKSFFVAIGGKVFAFFSGRPEFSATEALFAEPITVGSAIRTSETLQTL
jgi:hypothetical protein